MDTSVQNLLYHAPELYELMYPEFDEATPRMCLSIFDKYLGRLPTSILDMGCGTARDLNVLSRYCTDCYGVDFLPEMIAFAKGKRPHLQLQTGDMRSLRLGRTFDVILQLGSVLMYALSNEDIDSALNTLAAHARPGTLLVVDMVNAIGFLPGGSFQEHREAEIKSTGFNATISSTFSFDRRAQHYIRRRVWNIDSEAPVEDYCRYRMFFPAEIEHLLSCKGFQLAGMFDNMELKETDFTGQSLFMIARFKP